MPQNKYIGTKETARLTGLSMQEIYDLIHKGTLVAHKAPKSGWRIPFQVLVDLNLIKEEEESPRVKVSFTYAFCLAVLALSAFGSNNLLASHSRSFCLSESPSMYVLSLR